MPCRLFQVTPHVPLLPCAPPAAQLSCPLAAQLSCGAQSVRSSTTPLAHTSHRIPSAPVPGRRQHTSARPLLWGGGREAHLWARVALRPGVLRKQPGRHRAPHTQRARRGGCAGRNRRCMGVGRGVEWGGCGCGCLGANIGQAWRWGRRSRAQLQAAAWLTLLRALALPCHAQTPPHPCLLRFGLHMRAS